MRRLEVILKLAETCNIACTYCYYFLSGDDRIGDRPGQVTDRTVEGLVRFLNDAYLRDHIDEAKIILHGGEPLMIGKRRFDLLCKKLAESVQPSFTLNMTTNGTLLDDEWISLLARWDVSTCVSLDGPEDVHDARRIDKRGRGTYTAAVHGLKLLQRAHDRGKLTAPAVLVVVDPQSDPCRTYDHLVHELGIRELDFLMPDETWDSPLPPAAAVANYMAALMHRWLVDDDPTIRVRTLRSVLSLWATGASYLAGFGGKPALVMTVGSDGEIDTDDFLKPCGSDVVATRQNITAATYEDVFESLAATELTRALMKLPDDCSGCAFACVCRGGQATHRHSRAKGFNNRSVYCEAHTRMFDIGLRHLLNTGATAERLLDVNRVPELA